MMSATNVVSMDDLCKGCRVLNLIDRPTTSAEILHRSFVPVLNFTPEGGGGGVLNIVLYGEALP